MYPNVMKKFTKCLLGAVTAVSVMVMNGVTVFADDFEFDMSKAKQSQGGGKAYTEYTRLDNETRHQNNFDPTWITEDSAFEVEYTYEGSFDEFPMYLILQSWQGDKVDSQEDKWVKIEPTEFDDTHAVWSYDTFSEAWESSDFSNVYALLIEDNNVQLTLSSFTVTNVDVPEDITEFADGELVSGDTEEADEEENDSEAA
jgi:hypothetical protein